MAPLVFQLSPSSGTYARLSQSQEQKRQPLNDLKARTALAQDRLDPGVGLANT